MAKLSEKAASILSQCTVMGNIMMLPSLTLDKKLFTEVQRYVEVMGGLWKAGKTKGFVFESADEGFIRSMIAAHVSAAGKNTKKGKQATLPEDKKNNQPLPAASAGERSCAVCGCHEQDACKHPEHGNCTWADDHLCSHCQDYPGEATRYSLLLNRPEHSNKHNMKKQITISSGPLMAVLKKVKEVISKKSTMPILGNILFKVRKSELTITATDLEVTIIGSLSMVNDHEQEYEFLLPFDFMYNITGMINGLDMTVELIEKKKATDAVLTTLTNTFNLEALDKPEDFPALPAFPIENSVGISGDIITWLNLATNIADSSSPNPAMQKIYIDVATDGITMAATNAKILFEKKFVAEARNTTTVLVSPKIAKALKGFEQTSLSWSDSHIAFVSDKITMIGKTQSEKFPAYQQFLQIPEEGKIVMPLADLKHEMELMSLTKKEATIYLKREIGMIILESSDEQNLKMTSRMGLDYSGDCEKLLVRPDQVLNLLGHVDYQTVNLFITASNKPVLVTTDSDDSYRALFVPYTV